jgi:hypothetical protein
VRPQDLIGVGDAAKIYGLGTVAFWRRRKAGLVPDPILQIGNRPIFDRSAIEAAAAAEKATAS